MLPEEHGSDIWVRSKQCSAPKTVTCDNPVYDMFQGIRVTIITMADDDEDGVKLKLYNYHALLVRQASGSEELRQQIVRQQQEAELERKV